MTVESPRASPPLTTSDCTSPSIRSISAPALALWLLIQLACLALAVLHVPLAASYPPGERLAMEVLLAGQVGSAAILSPMLCRTAGTALLAGASVWPTLLLAGALQMKPLSSSVLAAIVVTCWLGMLWVWSGNFSRAGRAVVAAAAFLIATGPPLLGYLKSEFGVDADHAGGAIDRALESTPTLLAWNFSSAPQLQISVTIAWGAIFGLGLAIKLLRR